MMGAHHAISGAAAWLALTATAPALQIVDGVAIPVSTGLLVEPAPIALLGALVVAGFALVPDLDHHSATAAQSVPVLGKVLAGSVSAAAGGHRKGTHTIWAALAAVVLAWFASKFVWQTGTWVGAVSIGLVLVTAPAIAFAVYSIKALRIINTWPKAWIVGVVTAVVIAAGIRSSFSWLLVAIGVGYLVHLVGDYLTVEGIPPTYPWVPRPPKAWSSNRFLTQLWHENGYVSLPLLGETGSVREWALAVVLTGYVAYCAFFEVLVGLHSVPHL